MQSLDMHKRYKQVEAQNTSNAATKKVESTMMRRARLMKVVLAGTLWVLLHIPMDLILIQQAHSDVVAFAISVQLLDVFILSYMFYQLLSLRLLTPWKCVVCDGWGRRMFVPGLAEEKKAQLSVCHACQGSGVIWERR